jgi:hypothetical protein
MKRISGGQTSVGADAKLLSSHAGDPRAATGDTTDISHTGRHIPVGRQPVMESARRRPEDLPAGSDVTGPQPETLTQRPVIRNPPAEGLAIRVAISRCLSATGICFSVILHPPGSWALLTVRLPANDRTPTGFPRSARTSSDRGGRPLYPEDGGAHPDRSWLPAGACRFAAASPCTQPYIPSTGFSLNETSTRFQAIRPSGLPPACGRPDGTGRPWTFASGFTPRRPRADDARRGGDRPSSTDLELPLNSHLSISYPVAHSMRATSRRTPRMHSPVGLRVPRSLGQQGVVGVSAESRRLRDCFRDSRGYCGGRHARRRCSGLIGSDDEEINGPQLGVS